MEQYKLGEMEQKFADLIWIHEPVKSRVLSELCAEAFSWKRTTTYTMLKRLCDRKIFENQNSTVVALMSRSEFGVTQGEKFLNEAFDGSLPQILNMSFTASLVILAVIVARLLLRKAPHAISYALWIVVLFRLVCLFSFEADAKAKAAWCCLRRWRVYLTEGIVSPFVMGLFCLKIYLPISLIENEKRYILLHEQTHIKRFDHVVKIVSFAVAYTGLIHLFG